jgi:hypothetical protein
MTIIKNVALKNYTGKSADISFNEKKRSFSYHGYNFNLTPVSNHPDDNFSVVSLTGKEWNNEVLESFFFDGFNPSIEQQIKKALPYIANCI